MSLTRAIGKRAPTILAMFAGAGVLVTIGLTVKATIKAKDTIDARQKEEDVVLSKEEIIKEVWKDYIPVASITILTLVCIIGSRMTSQKQINTITGAYLLAGKSFHEYRQKVRDLAGGEVDDQVMDSIIGDSVNKEYVDMEDRVRDLNDDDAKFGIEIPHDEVLRMFYEPISDEYFMASMASVLRSINEFSTRYNMRGAASVNEWLDLLGIPTHVDSNFGWNVSYFDWGHEYLSFDIRKAETKGDLYYVKVGTLPVYDYLAY